MTAAHCVDDAIVSSISVIVGEHNIDDDDFERLAISKIVVDPLWNPALYERGSDSEELPANDFAILTLAEPLSFSAEVSPVCLPWDTAKDYSGEVATTAGWGLKRDGDQLQRPAVLQEVDLTVLSNNVCQQEPLSKDITE